MEKVIAVIIVIAIIGGIGYLIFKWFAGLAGVVWAILCAIGNFFVRLWPFLRAVLRIFISVPLPFMLFLGGAFLLGAIMDSGSAYVNSIGGLALILMYIPMFIAFMFFYHGWLLKSDKNPKMLVIAAWIFGITLAIGILAHIIWGGVYACKFVAENWVVVVSLVVGIYVLIGVIYCGIVGKSIFGHIKTGSNQYWLSVSPKDNQPAITKLFWLPIYKVLFYSLWNTLLDLWKNCHHSRLIEKSPVFWILVLPFVVLMYPALFSVCVIVAVAMLLATFSNYLIGGAVYASDSIFLKIKGIGLVCPKCNTKYQLPTYICSNPSCQAEHTNLRPGKYGLFKRRCKCGAKLPTTFFNGRQTLVAKCPNQDCNHLFAELIAPARQICIPIIGGVNSGKTTLINAGVEELIDFAADAKNNIEFSYYSDDDKKRHEDKIKQMRQGFSEKTKQGWDSYKIYFSPCNAMVKDRIYIYDVDGEIYDEKNRGRIEKNKVFDYTNSLLFVVDPLSIDEVYEEFSEITGKNKYERSDRNINNVVTNMLNSLNSFELTQKSLKKTNVAIVFTKYDIPMIKEQLGNERVAYTMQQENVSWLQAKNMVCEDFLKRYHAMNFLNLIKSRFEHYQFFTCATYQNEQKELVVENVKEPFLWLIENESPELNFKRLWNKA